MSTISNKTQRPLSIPLPRGCTLHLGPGKTAEIAANASRHPQLVKMIADNEIEIVEDAGRANGSGGSMGRASVFATPGRRNTGR